VRAAAAVATLALGLASIGGLARAAVFEIQIADVAGEGYFDPTPRDPVGGNVGTTLGEQRLMATQAAANVWGAFIHSDIPIVISAQFNPLPCEPLAAQLGIAGPRSLFRDFTGVPLTGTWYPSALADAVAGRNLAPGMPDINATFSSSIDTGCFTGAPEGWYYGLDGNPPEGKGNLFNTVLHELAHGLGFSSTVNLASGAKQQGFNDVFMRHLEDHSNGKVYPDMNDAERLAASTKTGNLHWVGPNARGSGGFLQTGRTGDHLHMYAPNPQEPGSSVVHWDISLEPSEIMEPFFVAGSLRTLTEALLIDIGWSLAQQASPTPSPSPTPPATRTPTLSATATASLTASRTATITPPPQPPTNTPTRTHTSTPVPTPTITPTPRPGDPGDGNCDSRRGAADIIAVIVALEQGEPVECPGVDADDDGDIDTQDVGAAITGLFGG
jgi:hypothetical protein